MRNRVKYNKGVKASEAKILKVSPPRIYVCKSVFVETGCSANKTHAQKLKTVVSKSAEKKDESVVRTHNHL